jgi:hypothetical protein
MNREQVRDQLLAPVLKWTRLGRQTSRLMVASMAVISHRRRRLMRAGQISGASEWTELALMTHEKIQTPLESAVAMTAAIQTEAQQFLTQGGTTALTVVGGAMALASSRNADEFRARQVALGEALIGAAVSWFQLYGSVAEIAAQSLQPVIRRVEANEERLR